jgi:hypothetical protein
MPSWQSASAAKFITSSAVWPAGTVTVVDVTVCSEVPVYSTALDPRRTLTDLAAPAETVLMEPPATVAPTAPPTSSSASTIALICQNRMERKSRTLHPRAWGRRPSAPGAARLVPTD